jgi:hypothetical protein
VDDLPGVTGNLSFVDEMTAQDWTKETMAALADLHQGFSRNDEEWEKLPNDIRTEMAYKAYAEWKDKYGDIATKCEDIELAAGAVKINEDVEQTTVAPMAPLPLSEGRLSTAANVQAALESSDPGRHAFLATEQVFSATDIDDLDFPDFEMFEKVCRNGHPMAKVSMSSFLQHTSKATFNCVMCYNEIGMDRATVAHRGPTYMKCCSTMCEPPYEATCAQCAGFPTRTDTTAGVTSLHAITMHGQLLADAGYSQQDIGQSMTARTARLEALRMLPPTTTPTDPESCLAERPGALCDPDGEWILIETQHESTDAAL